MLNPLLVKSINSYFKGNRIRKATHARKFYFTPRQGTLLNKYTDYHLSTTFFISGLQYFI